MKNKLVLIRKEAFCLIYIVALFLCFYKVGEVNKITTYNVAGINSVMSSQLKKEYVPPLPEIEEKLVNNSPQKYEYRLTSYYLNDDCNSTDCTGAGFCAKDLVPNEKGWYTYNGKLVIAAATTYMQNVFGVKENKLYFKYYDELLLTIDGVEYEAIVLDTCGACYKNEIIDLFVKDASSAIDRGYKGKNMITLEVAKKK